MTSRPALALCFALAGCGCPVDDQGTDPGVCVAPESAGSVTVTFNGGNYSSPSCWEAAGQNGQEASLASDNVNFGNAALGLSVVFYANQQNDPQQPACAFASGMSVPLTSSCLSLTATGTDTFIAGAGYAAVEGAVAPTGTLTLAAWPADAGTLLGITFSPGAQLLYVPALNGTTGDAGLLPISGSATGESLGPVGGDLTSD